eukprot:2935083-Amphidinium_carterae.1
MYLSCARPYHARPCTHRSPRRVPDKSSGTGDTRGCACCSIALPTREPDSQSHASRRAQSDSS